METLLLASNISQKNDSRIAAANRQTLITTNSSNPLSPSSSSVVIPRVPQQQRISHGGLPSSLIPLKSGKHPAPSSLPRSVLLQSPSPFYSSPAVFDETNRKLLEQQQQQQQQKIIQEKTIEIETNHPLGILMNKSVFPSSSSPHGDGTTRNGGHESSSFTIVPCKARGMENGHNFKSANFRVHENTPHGSELHCSYPACRASGVKFRYCEFCQVPVAKRNFRKRHLHSSVKVASTIGRGRPKGSSLDTSSSFSSLKRKRSVEEEEEESSTSSSEDEESEIHISQTARVIEKQSKHLMQMGDNNNNNEGESIQNPSFASQPPLQQQQQQPIPMLQPPLGLPGLSAASFPPSNNSLNSFSASSSNLLKNYSAPMEANRNLEKWSQLFWERPPSNLSTELNAWLLKCLDVSNDGHVAFTQVHQQQVQFRNENLRQQLIMQEQQKAFQVNHDALKKHREAMQNQVLFQQYSSSIQSQKK